MDHIEHSIRNIPDFPKPGIQFKDITPLLSNGAVFKETINAFAERYRHQKIDVVVGIEARGFVFASALAYALNAGTCMIRKPGKLPHSVHQQTYELEYGTDSIEIHTDAFQPDQNIILIDDVLATGGTIAAATELIQNNFNVHILGIEFLMELTFLNGRNKIKHLPVNALIHY